MEWTKEKPVQRCERNQPWSSRQWVLQVLVSRLRLTAHLHAENLAHDHLQMQNGGQGLALS